MRDQELSQPLARYSADTRARDVCIWPVWLVWLGQTHGMVYLSTNYGTSLTFIPLAAQARSRYGVRCLVRPRFYHVASTGAAKGCHIELPLVSTCNVPRFPRGITLASLDGNMTIVRFGRSESLMGSLSWEQYKYAAMPHKVTASVPAHHALRPECIPDRQSSPTLPFIAYTFGIHVP